MGDVQTGKRRIDNAEGGKRGTYNAVALPTFLNMVPHCGGYGFAPTGGEECIRASTKRDAKERGCVGDGMAGVETGINPVVE